MAKENEIPRLSRLAAILVILQSKRIITAAEIAGKFNISVRTVYRDIRALEQAGIPISVEDRKGYTLMEGFSLPPIMFTEEEANAFITIEKIIAAHSDKSLIENYEKAITKIKAVLQYSNKDKTALLSERIALTQPKQEPRSNSLSKIQSAITNLIVVEINYHSISKNELTKRVVEPQAIYLTNENWVLIAWCRLRNNLREFRLDRIQKLQPLNETFKTRNFNLSEYFSVIVQKYSDNS